MSGRSIVMGVAWALATAAAAHAPDDPAAQASAPAHAAAKPARPAVHHATPKLDLSGQKRTGKASFYGDEFAGRRMADGTRMHPQGDGAASKTLPLGTTARVTNPATGQSAVVTIRDRGPYVRGRIVDLSPATAAKVGIDRHDGVSQVEVTPITLPPRDAGAKPGPASPDARPDVPRTASTSSPR